MFSCRTRFLSRFHELLIFWLLLLPAVGGAIRIAGIGNEQVVGQKAQHFLWIPGPRYDITSDRVGPPCPKNFCLVVKVKKSGEGGIRTLGDVAATPVFETGPIGRSGTSPCGFSSWSFLILRHSILGVQKRLAAFICPFACGSRAVAACRSAKMLSVFRALPCRFGCARQRSGRGAAGQSLQMFDGFGPIAPLQYGQRSQQPQLIRGGKATKR